MFQIVIGKYMYNIVMHLFSIIGGGEVASGGGGDCGILPNSEGVF